MDQRRKDVEEDYPPHSRLFIICGRNVTDDMLRKAFGSYGHIEDIFIPKDHSTGSPRGVAYIKFRKTSEAAYALEGMHGTLLKNGGNRPLKVMVASNRSDIQQSDREMDSLERFMRLFVTVPKQAKEDEVSRYFSEFGSIRCVDILRDHQTGNSKGFAYVSFKNFSDAAVAFESADRKYKAVFAQPKQNRRPQTNFESSINSLADTSGNNSNLMLASLYQAMDVKAEGYTRVKFMCCPYVTSMNAYSIFNLIPGLVDCQYAVDLMRNCGKGIAFYANPTSAAYAVQKLNTFEYPPGQPILVKPDFHNSGPDNYQQVSNKIPGMVNTLHQTISSANNSGTPDLAKLTEAIAEASKLVQMATLGTVDSNKPQKNDLNYCSVKLPDPKPLAHIDSPMAKRCFLVCKPKPPPLTVLRDIFCRFGNLITVYALSNKTVGYACYATVESADEARNTLHGAEVMGVRMKVLEAEEEDPSRSRKRRFLDTERDD